MNKITKTKRFSEDTYVIIFNNKRVIKQKLSDEDKFLVYLIEKGVNTKFKLLEELSDIMGVNFKDYSMLSDMLNEDILDDVEVIDFFWELLFVEQYELLFQKAYDYSESTIEIIYEEKDSYKLQNVSYDIDKHTKEYLFNYILNGLFDNYQIDFYFVLLNLLFQN